MSGMQEKLPNGATVNRLYADGENTELIAMFQYNTDAEAFANAKVEDDAKHQLGPSIYLVTCTYSGRMKVFRLLKDRAQTEG